MSAEFVLFGPLEQLDFFTDGATPIQAFACEPSATDTYVKAFEASWASMVWVPLVMWLRFGGLLLLALSFAVAVQQGFSTTFGSGDVASVMLSADVAGMLGLATLYEKKSMEEQANVGLSGKAIFSLMYRVVIENLAQLYLQSAFFEILFERLTEGGRTKLLFSMGLGLASASQKLLTFLFRTLAWPAANVVTNWLVGRLVSWG
eukprot:g30909.t1